MNKNKSIISNKTHEICMDECNNPIISNNRVMLLNKSANSIIYVTISPAIRDMFGLSEADEDMFSQHETDVEDDGNFTKSYDFYNDQETSSQNQEIEPPGDLTEVLISEISKRPPLYNEKLPLMQRTRSIKKSLYIEISNVLEGSVTPEEIDKKWNYLKKEYKKQKGVLSKYIKSGCSYVEAAAIIGKPVWKHFSSLCFIDDPKDERVTFSNVEESEEDVIKVQCGPSPSSSSVVEMPSIKKRRCTENKQTDAVDRAILSHLNTEKMDSIDHFCSMVACDMRKLEMGDVSQLQAEILRLVHNKLLKK